MFLATEERIWGLLGQEVDSCWILDCLCSESIQVAGIFDILHDLGSLEMIRTVCRISMLKATTSSTFRT